MNEREKEFREWQYKTVEKIVKSGESKVFNNWHEYTGISMESFLEACKWLLEDPFVDTPAGKKMSREIACEKDGSITRLKRSYGVEGIVAFYRVEDGFIHYGSKAMLNCMDRV